MSDRLLMLVASANGVVGFAAGWEVLQAGRSALDAVEAVARVVEDNVEDHTVGYAGYPNLLGEVELDAAVMEGSTRRAGAVGALSGFRHAVSVARAVMERTPHVLLAGAGAARMAEEIGLEREQLLTPEVETVWREGVAGKLGPEGFGAAMLSRVVHLARDPERVGGTVNVIAVDAHGRIAVATSTSGWAWKYPGRLGDTPVIGAGLYADDRYGAAACTGWGELALRTAAARSAVALLGGMPLERALVNAVSDMASLEPAFRDIHMHMIGVDAAGGYAAVSTKPGTEFAIQIGEMHEPELRPRRIVDPDEGIALSDDSRRPSSPPLR